MMDEEAESSNIETKGKSESATDRTIPTFQYLREGEGTEARTVERFYHHHPPPVQTSTQTVLTES